MITPSSKVLWPKNDAYSNLMGLEILSKFNLWYHNYFTSKGVTIFHGDNIETNRSEFLFKITTAHVSGEEFENKEQMIMLLKNYVNKTRRT